MNNDVRKDILRGRLILIEEKRELNKLKASDAFLLQIFAIVEDYKKQTGKGFNDILKALLLEDKEK